MSLNTKTCYICKQDLPADIRFFYRRSGSKDGLDGRCSRCALAAERASRAKWRMPDPIRDHRMGEIVRVDRGNGRLETLEIVSFVVLNGQSWFKCRDSSKRKVVTRMVSAEIMKNATVLHNAST